MDKRIILFDAKDFDLEWPPENFADAIEWFQRKLEAIPEEYRLTAKLEIDCEDDGYGVYYGHIRIVYTRSETKDEATQRMSQEKQQKEALRISELRQLELLRAKYNL